MSIATWSGRKKLLDLRFLKHLLIISAASHKTLGISDKAINDTNVWFVVIVQVLQDDFDHLGSGRRALSEVALDVLLHLVHSDLPVKIKVSQNSLNSIWKGWLDFGGGK